MQAAAIIGALPNEQLPRSSTDDGALVIARLVDPELLAGCSDAAVPVQRRMAQCLPLGDTASALFQRYIGVATLDRALADDALELSGFLLLYSTTANGLAHEFMPTIDSADPTYQTRLAGVAQMRRGMATMLRGGAMALTDRSRFSEAARVEYAAELAGAFEAMAPDFTAEQIGQVAAQFAQTTANEPNATIRATLNGAVERAGVVHP